MEWLEGVERDGLTIICHGYFDWIIVYGDPAIRIMSFYEKIKRGIEVVILEVEIVDWRAINPVNKLFGLDY